MPARDLTLCLTLASTFRLPRRIFFLSRGKQSQIKILVTKEHREAFYTLSLASIAMDEAARTIRLNVSVNLPRKKKRGLPSSL